MSNEDFLINRFKNLIIDINIREDFLEITNQQLSRKFADRIDLLSFIDLASDSDVLEHEKFILGVYFLIEYATTVFDIKGEILTEYFEEAARFLELLIEYSDEFQSKTEKYSQFLLLASLCYDLADKVANAKVIIEKVINLRKQITEPLNTFSELRFIIINAIIAYLSRARSELLSTVEFGLEMKHHFQLLVEENPEELHTLLASFQLLTSFQNVNSFWELGDKSELSRAINFLKKARNNFATRNEINLEFICQLLEISFKREFERSIHRLPNHPHLWKVYKYNLLERGIIDLWPPQLQAIDNGLLAERFFVVSAPTSAGKSLIAEINIISCLANNSNSKIIYLVPSRALAAQVKRNLEESLNPIGFNVGMLVGGLAFPSLDDYILETSSIIVFTSEKFEILYNQNNPYLQEITLLIIDESHNLGDGSRGLNLEILLTNLKTKEKAPAVGRLLSGRVYFYVI